MASQNGIREEGIDMKYEYSYNLSSGIALGGLGTGTIEIRSDGLFYDPTIFNVGSYSLTNRNEKIMNPGDIVFLTRIEELRQIRILASTNYLLTSSPYNTPWVRPTRKILFEGKGAIAELNYDNYGKIMFLSPTIPLDLKNSSIPTFVLSSDLPGESILVLKVPFKFSLRKIKEGLIISSRETNEDSPTYNGNLTILSDNTINVGRINDLRNAFADLRNDGIVEDQGMGDYVFLNFKPKSNIIFSWYFPNYRDNDGNVLGHYYENFFKDSEHVAVYVRENKNYLIEKTLQFVNSIYNTKNIPTYVADLVASQISALKKITVITKDFSVGIWEGYYDDVFDGPMRGAFNTADVAFHYAPGLLILYPDLLKNLLEQLYKFRLDYNTEEFIIVANSILENFVEYKRAILKDPSLLSDFKKIVETVKDIVKRTGKDPKDRIPHFFRIPNRRPVQGYHLLDASIKYLLMVYLYSKYTGDNYLLKTTEEVIQSIIRTHIKDGLPYHFTPAGIDQEWKTTFNFFRNQDMRDSARSLLGYTTSEISYQTFDDWSMIGFVSYTSILWYSAIKLLGKQKLVEEAENSLNKLWNGKYYDLWYDPESNYRDTACLSSQLMGVWYCRLVGENCFDEDNERKIMSEIFKNNFIEGEGLINGRYIDKPRPSEVGNIPYFNNTGLINKVGSQMDTPWTGVEFAFASHLLYLGMENEALKILKEVYDRYETAGMFWKHVEWGAYYSRPLSAFSIILAYEGINYDGEKKILKIRPRKKNLAWIILLPSFWGVMDYDEENRVIKIKVIKTKDGVADIHSIETNFPINEIIINGEKTRFPLRIKDNDEILIR